MHFKLLLFFAMTLVGGASVVFAQNSGLKLRTASHDEYSRLVFEWPNKTEYEVSKTSPDKLKITFKNANDVGAFKIDPVRNISGVAKLSDSPLAFEIDIASGARHRAFAAGARVVLDVYNTAESVKKQQAKADAAPTQKPKKVDAPVEEKPVQKADKQDVPDNIRSQLEALESDEAKVIVEGSLPKKVEPAAEEKNVTQKEAADVADVEEENIEVSKPVQSSNLISVSSSQSTGLAVFERGEQLWIVNDKKQALISPQVSGPNADYFLPFETLESESGKILITKTVERNFIRTQGGGLLWKIIISPQENRKKPITPDRSEMGRGGKIVWPFSEPGNIINSTDPLTGEDLIIVTAQSSKDFSGDAYSFVDFDILPTYAGLVIVPKVDDLQVKIKNAGVEISRPHGLNILSQSQIRKNTPVKIKPSNDHDDKKRIFDFQAWQLGGVEALADNQNILLSGINDLPKNARDEDIMTLAKTHLANAMGAEALGFLEILEDRNQDIANTPEFRAIRGAARAVDYKTEQAFSDLSADSLMEFGEIGFWKAYALADLGDWQQAIDVLPKDPSPLFGYPDFIQTRIGLTSAEVALRTGDVDMAKGILEAIERHKESLHAPQKAALTYLNGEAARQEGDIEKTKELWEPLTTGPDDLYRAKAGLALTRLLVDQKELPPGKAIDNLERLRYAWRGDELEAQINYWLGRTYFEAREFVKGLNIMREAASIAGSTKLGTRITNEMGDVFTSLFLSDELDKVSPLDAVALYEQFTELVPAGQRGDKIVERLADRLAGVDVLGKAASLLSYQLNHRIDGLDAYNVGVKLAAIQLIDNKPKEALAALNIAKQKLSELPEAEQTKERLQTLSLLRARALSRQGRPDQAIAMLSDMEPNTTINRLRADIAWTAGYWDDAAIALEDVILDQNISLTRPLSDEDSALILQRAVALSLSGNRIALANMREKYADAMAQTSKARVFDVITRSRKSSALADRETLMGIVSEVDLFSDFLNGYKETSTQPSN